METVLISDTGFWPVTTQFSTVSCSRPRKPGTTLKNIIFPSTPPIPVTTGDILLRVQNDHCVPSYWTTGSRSFCSKMLMTSWKASLGMRNVAFLSVEDISWYVSTVVTRLYVSHCTLVRRSRIWKNLNDPQSCWRVRLGCLCCFAFAGWS